MWFEGTAWAQSAAGPGSASSEQVVFTTIVPLALLFGVFYFLIIRPQTKKAQEHTQMLSALKRNDEIVTNGGLIGRIHELGDKVVTLEIAPNVRVRVERSQVAGLSSHGKAPSVKKEKSE